MLIRELQSLGLDIKVLNINNEEIDLKQSFDDDDDFVPHAVSEADENMDFSLDDGDLDEGFMAEDEDGVSELELDSDDDFADDLDDTDLFLSDDEE